MNHQSKYKCSNDTSPDHRSATAIRAYHTANLSGQEDSHKKRHVHARKKSHAEVHERTSTFFRCPPPAAHPLFGSYITVKLLCCVRVWSYNSSLDAGYISAVWSQKSCADRHVSRIFENLGNLQEKDLCMTVPLFEVEAPEHIIVTTHRSDLRPCPFCPSERAKT